MDEPGRCVAVTGASGYIGAALVRRLQSESWVERVVALDVRPPGTDLGPKAHSVRHDVSLPFDGVLEEHRPDTVVHLAFVLNPSRDSVAARRVNVDGAANLLDECARNGVRKIVYLSSTTVYGAHPDNPPMLTEESPPRPAAGFQYSHDKLAAERLIDEYASSNPSVVVTVLRGCPVVGPNADNFIARAFLKRVLVAAWGHDPLMQLLHEDDLTEVLTACVARDAPGLYNVAAGGTLRWSEMVRSLGRPLLRMPAPLLRGATAVSWAFRLQSESPPAGLGFIMHPWTVSVEKLTRELGIPVRYTSTQAWQSFAQARGTAPKEGDKRP